MPKNTYSIKIKNNPATISIGTKVLIDVNGELQVWEIVNSGKSDIQKGRISYDAPLIQCILGRKEGEVVNCRIIDQDVVIAIKRIIYTV